MRKALAVLVLAILFISAIGPGEGQEDGEGEIIVKETRITNNSAYQRSPRIFKNYIVWEDDRNIQDPNATYTKTNYDIFGYDNNSGTEFQITTNASPQVMPDIWENNVIWTDYRSEGDGLGIYNLTENEEIINTPIPFPKNKPYRIYENNVVWKSHQDGNDTIILYNIIDNSRTIIYQNSSRLEKPDIWGDWVVWEAYLNGDIEVFLYNLTTLELKRITNKVGNQEEPLISGNYMVYNDRGETPWTGYYYDINEGISRRINQSGGTIYDLWGDYIVWAGHGNLWVYFISLNESFILTDEVLGDVAIYENKVVGKKENSVGKTDIYLLEFTLPEPQQPSEPSFWEQNGMPIGLGITFIIVAIILVFLLRGKKRGKRDGNNLKIE